MHPPRRSARLCAMRKEHLPVRNTPRAPHQRSWLLRQTPKELTCRRSSVILSEPGLDSRPRRSSNHGVVGPWNRWVSPPTPSSHLLFVSRQASCCRSKSQPRVPIGLGFSESTSSTDRRQFGPLHPVTPWASSITARSAPSTAPSPLKSRASSGEGSPQ